MDYIFFIQTLVIIPGQIREDYLSRIFIKQAGAELDKAQLKLELDLIELTGWYS